MLISHNPDSNKQNNGRGKDLPPELSHVKIWFSQNGSAEHMAIEFYKFYKKKKWCGEDGKKLRDWKMYAWHWLWK